MNDLYLAVGALVLAQLVGLYALKTGKADLVFALFMGILLLAALGLAGSTVGVFHHL